MAVAVAEHLPFLSEHERQVLRAIATAALPAGRRFPAADADTVAKAEAFVAALPTAARSGYRGLIVAIDAQAVALTGHSFAGLPLGRRLELMESWHRHEATRLTLRGLLAPLKIAYFDNEQVYDAAGTRYRVEPPAVAEEPKWQQQIIEGPSFEKDEVLECDVVVVGTGAGGAVMAKELAEAGWAVVLLEEGRHFTRKDFTGRAVEMTRKLYRNSGLTMSLGNTAIPIPVGRTVGGTTTINSGTCLRPPESTFAGWRKDYGLTELSSESMDPYYRRVEAMLQVAPAEPGPLGAVGALIAKGCDVLGYSHRPLTRNASGCDGQGLCCFGCPTEAKRSTNVSYIPAALERSAQLITEVKVEKVLVERERAVGVVGSIARPDGRRVSLTVRARVVVLACGTLHTPTLLLQNGLANASGELGRNLSIHPASSAFGVFDEMIDGSQTIPQGYSIDEFHAKGILFEGASIPLELLAATHTGFGPGYIDLFERFNHLLQFGYMVKDSSRGRVRPGPGGDPLITYNMNDDDLAKVQLGMVILSRVLFAAGAREVYPTVVGYERLRHQKEVDALAHARLAPRHFDLSAYHPLGTARMGRDPLKSVVDTTHETHDVHNLFVTDGSSIPGSLGVNPQLTIMAMATRAAEFVGRRLERLQNMGAVG